MNDHDEAPEHEHSTEQHRHGPRGRRGAFLAIFVLVFAVVIAAIAFTGESLGHHRTGSTSTVTVTGSGTVMGTPNTMSFTIGFQSTSPSAVAALAANNTKVEGLEASLLTHGVTKKNLQTSGLNIYDDTNNAGQVTGFTVEDQLSVTTHQLTKAGATIDAAVRSVGNGIEFNGVSFSISNQSKLLAAARARAITNAHVEAADLAKGGGTTVGHIIKVTDQENNASTGIVYPLSFATARAASSAVPIQQGSQSINVQVTVIYSLSD